MSLDKYVDELGKRLDVSASVIDDYEAKVSDRRRRSPWQPDPEPPPVCEGQLDIIDAFLPTALDELQRAPVTT